MNSIRLSEEQRRALEAIVARRSEAAGVVRRAHVVLWTADSVVLRRNELKPHRLRAWNRNPTPFEWTKPARAIIRSHHRMLDRISKAVH